MSKSIRSFFQAAPSSVDDNNASSRKKAKLSTTTEPSEASEDIKKPVETSSAKCVDILSTEVVSTECGAPAAVAPTNDVVFGWPPFDSMEPGWKASLASEFNRPYFKNLLQFLASEAKSQTIYPPAQDIFSAFNLCPLDQVKVLSELQLNLFVLWYVFCLSHFVSLLLCLVQITLSGGGNWSRPLSWT